MSELVQSMVWLSVWTTLWLGLWLLIGALAVALLFALIVPLALSGLYLLGLTLLSGRPRPLAGLPATTGAAAGPGAGQAMSGATFFDIVVPAHDERALIARTVGSLRALDWPAGRFRVCVVADNCSDDTAALARAAGAVVWVRDDPTLRGKGHALAHGFALSRQDARAAAVVVIDADSLVSANLLAACHDRLVRGAQAVQVHHGVLNVQDSWRTRLMTIALTAFHRVRSRGRERLGLSCGLRGNGWCVTHALLQAVPYRAWSLAEDIEYGIDLGLAGVRVQHADEARVEAEMVNASQAAESQRRRWEDGRWQLLRERLGDLGRAALQRGRPRAGRRVCLDLAVDLLVPQLSTLLLGAVLLLALGSTGWLLLPTPVAGLPRIADGLRDVAAVLGLTGLGVLLALVLHVLRGWQLSGVGWRGLADLLRVPGYVAWKLLVMLRAHDTAEWVRTRRERA